MRLAALALLLLGCTRAVHARPLQPRERPRWLKGQTHVHSGNSGDSHTPPADVVRWYAAHGFDFIVFTDHNVVTRARPSPRPDLLVFPGVELTWNAADCGPPESPCNLHVNALFVRDPAHDHQVSLAPADPTSRASVYDAELDLAASEGGIAQLNHPNFRYGADAALIAHLAHRGLRLVEFSNESSGCQNEGDATHPSTEALWDRVLTLGADVWNVASDDAHHYYDAAEVRARGETADVGNVGWVMVRATPSGESIRAALMRGEFYASNGVVLDDITAAGGALTVTVGGATAPRSITTFVVDPGVALRTVTGARASLAVADLPRAVRWVRATVDDGAGHRAWVQPLRVVRDGRGAHLRGPFGDEPAP